MEVVLTMYGKVVGIGKNVKLFGQAVKHLAMTTIPQACHLCKAPVLTKHAVTNSSLTATKQQ